MNHKSLIIKVEKKKKNNDSHKNDNKVLKIKENTINSEDNGYQFTIENEQGMNTGINSVKTNNFIINKPKEENLKFSSIKEFLDDNDEPTEISPSQISKIIIGQIEGYKDIIDEDKNININDKSKSILELLSKYSFSYIKNNKQSIENLDNLNFLEDSNDIKIIGNNITNNSRNITTDNMPNLTNIKNVDEDYDSEELSISIFKNNIKSINTHSKVYLNKIFYNKSNNKNKSKNNIQNNNIKNSMNTNNTTISSGKNINKDNNINIGVNKYIYNNNENIIKVKDNKFNSKKISPSSSSRYHLNHLNNLKNVKISYSNDKKNNTKSKSKNKSQAKSNTKSKSKSKTKSKTKSKNSKNDKKIIYLKNINNNNIIKKIETTKRLNSNKSSVNIYKNINTNIIFNINKNNNNNKKKIKNINELLNKSPSYDKKSNATKSNEETNQTRINNNFNIPIINFIKENEEIVKAYFDNIEKKKYGKNNNNCSNNNINEKNNVQCVIF